MNFKKRYMYRVKKNELSITKVEVTTCSIQNVFYTTGDCVIRHDSLEDGRFLWFETIAEVRDYFQLKIESKTKEIEDIKEYLSKLNKEQ